METFLQERWKIKENKPSSYLTSVDSNLRSKSVNIGRDVAKVEEKI